MHKKYIAAVGLAAFLILGGGLWAAQAYGLLPSLFTIGSQGAAVATASLPANDIRRLNNEFINPSEGLGAWQIDYSNYSLTKYPGYLSVIGTPNYEVNMITQQPIRMDEHPGPWQFDMGITQDMWVTKALNGGPANVVYGLNLVTTTDDPSTWPAARTGLPQNYDYIQVLFAHVGDSGEHPGKGIPSLQGSDLNSGDPAPEAFLMSIIAPNHPEINGVWEIPYVWFGEYNSVGSGGKDGGPASFNLRFRVAFGPVVNGQQQLTLSVGFDEYGWRSKSVYVTPISGVWKIGPTIKGSSFFTNGGVAGLTGITSAVAKTPPSQSFSYYIDYLRFHRTSSADLNQFSENFDVPGFPMDEKFTVEGNAKLDTLTAPGYLNFTFLGNGGSAAICSAATDSLDFSKHPMPLEMEVTWRANDAQRWNVWWNLLLTGTNGKSLIWQPGVESLPGTGRRYSNSYTENSQITPSVSNNVIGNGEVDMLLQFPDSSHVRVGFRTPGGQWNFSPLYNVVQALGAPLAQMTTPCLLTWDSAYRNGTGQGNYPGYSVIQFNAINFSISGKGSIASLPAKPPTCALTATPAGASSTIAWSSTDTTEGTITPSIGAVGPQGSATVAQATTSTTYTGTFNGPAGSATCTATLQAAISGTPATLNPADAASILAINGNSVTAKSQTSSHGAVRATVAMTTGKYYWEVWVSNGPESFGQVNTVGVMTKDAQIGPGASGYLGGSAWGFGWGYATDKGNYYSSGFTPNGAAPGLTQGTKRFAYDADARKLWIGDATGWFGGGDPAAGTAPTATFGGPAGTPLYPAASMYYAIEAEGFVFNFGQQAYAYPMPAGYSSLSSQ